MAAYVVMQPPGAAHSTGEAMLVRDAFSWLAFLVPPLWLLWHRLWFAAAAAAILLGALSLLGETVGFGLTAPLASLAVALWFGLEGQGLRIAALRRRGWREWGVVQAENRDEAELRYGLEAEPAAPQTPAPHRIVPDPAHARPSPAGLVLGLPPLSGKH
ncbi:putative lipid-binding transport protein (Tim44 family) [Aquamicrobium terrae]